MIQRKLTFFLLIISALFCLPSYTRLPGEALHPYHVGSVEFNYNQKSGTFEITGKFFLDDLENALKQKYGETIHFNDQKHKARTHELLQKYCAEYLKLKADQKFVKINYLGFEEESESVNIFLESESVAAPHKVETAVSLLYNLFDDQMNIIHIIVNNKRQSEKLNFPDRYLYKNF